MTTPHMVVIDPNGNVVYDSAIDSKASTQAYDIPIKYPKDAWCRAAPGRRH